MSRPLVVVVAASIFLMSAPPVLACAGHEHAAGEVCPHHKVGHAAGGHHKTKHVSAPAAKAKPGKGASASASSAKAKPSEATAAATRTSRFGTIAPLAARDLLAATPAVRFIDVREADEFAAGRPAGTVNLPLSAIDTWAPTLDRAGQYVMTCRSGRRSAEAAERLVALGISDVRNMTGGYLAWEQAGLPVEEADPAPVAAPVAVPAGN